MGEGTEPFDAVEPLPVPRPEQRQLIIRATPRDGPGDGRLIGGGALEPEGGRVEPIFRPLPL